MTTRFLTAVFVVALLLCIPHSSCASDKTPSQEVPEVIIYEEYTDLPLDKEAPELVLGKEVSELTYTKESPKLDVDTELTLKKKKSKFISDFIFFPTTQERSAKEEYTEEEIKRIKSNEGLGNLFKNKKFRFLPVPVISSKPVIGQTYGVSLSALLVDKDTDRIAATLTASPRWNTNLKAMARFSAAIRPRYYSQPRESFVVAYEIARKTLRRLLVRYFSPHLTDLLYLDCLFERATDPYGRFYGLGADTAKGDVSSYTDKRIKGNATVGVYLQRHLRINTALNMSWYRLQNTIFSGIANTLTTYGGLNQVRDTTNLKFTISATYDTREFDMYSEKGVLVDVGTFFSVNGAASDYDQIGFYLESIALIPWLEGRTQTAVRFHLQDMYGDGIPFYHLSSLGGQKELMAYPPTRFIDTGKIIFQLEQRFAIASVKIYKTVGTLEIAPYFSAGRVFHHLNNLSFDDIKPMGGIGFRVATPPTFLLRADISFGDEGTTLYLTGGYPF